MIKDTTIKGVSELRSTGEIKAGKVEQLKQQEEASKRTSRYEDRFTPSQMAEELGKARQIFNALPEIRADKVEEIKAQINSGTYQINAEAVAETVIKAFISR